MRTRAARFFVALLSALAGMFVALATVADAGPADVFQALVQAFGAPVSSAAPSDNQVLTYSSTTKTWAAATPSSTPQFSQLGLGTAAVGTTTITVASPGMSISGQYVSLMHTTSAGVIDWSTGNVQSIQLANNGSTWTTFSNGIPGGRYLLRLKQPSSGAAGTVTWPSQVHWSGGTAPTLTATNSQVDWISFVFDGTSYFGASNLNYAP